MAMGRVRTRLEDNWDQIIPAANRVIKDITVKTAFDVKGDAQSTAAVDTGAYKASHYVVFDGGTDYAQAAAESEQVQPGVELFRNDVQVEHDLQALICIGVLYGWWVHNGTSRQAPQPNLESALNAAESDYQKAIVAGLNGLKI